MKIQKLSEDTRKNLLEDLLKRSPNSYGQYEASVAEILNTVKEKKDEALFAYTKNSTVRISVQRTYWSQRLRLRKPTGWWTRICFAWFEKL